MSNTLAPLPLRLANVRRFLNARADTSGRLSGKDTEKLYNIIVDQVLPVVLRYNSSTRLYDIVLLERPTQAVEDTKDFYVLTTGWSWRHAYEHASWMKWEVVQLFQTEKSHS